MAASLQAQPSVAATLTWAQRDCLAATTAMNDVAGPLEQQDAAGVVAAGKLAQFNESTVSESVTYGNHASQLLAVAEYADTVLGEIVTIANNAAAYEQYGAAWSFVTDGEASLADTFNSLESYCLAAGAAIGASQPAVTPAPGMAASEPPAASPPSTDPVPYSAGCPTSEQLLAAWNAAPASIRGSWVTGLTPTGFTGTQCWHQWVVSNPVIQANGSVVFTDTNGQLAVFPEPDLNEFDAAICGIPGIGPAWSGPAGPGSCSNTG